MKLAVHIERLVLDGLPVASHNGPAVGAAVEAELARLFTDKEITPDWGTGTVLPRLHGGSIHITHDARPSAVGQEIAAAVHRSISQTGGARLPVPPSLSFYPGARP